MMDINCSEKCIHERNGKCTLNRINSITNFSSLQTNCMYFSPKDQIKNKDLPL
ncbi:hydroxymyristoyl-ACP dehydratase [Clostridium sp. Mt-5]|uniref:Hydroxymyristoyl-ACP dehydratase n=1 Tax=Clostridium moutaii TaxID=3240932 RepID=A0ABV4BPQ7_9CLOT